MLLVEGWLTALMVLSLLAVVVLTQDPIKGIVGGIVSIVSSIAAITLSTYYGVWSVPVLIKSIVPREPEILSLMTVLFLTGLIWVIMVFYSFMISVNRGREGFMSSKFWKRKIRALINEK